MKRLIVIVLGITLLFLSGCAGAGLSNNAEEVLLDIGSSEAGYRLGKAHPEKRGLWVKWVDKLLAFEVGDLVVGWEKVLAHGLSEYIAINPYEEMQLERLLKLLDLPDLQPPETPFLTEEYLAKAKIVLLGFKEGLLAAPDKPIQPQSFQEV